MVGAAIALKGRTASDFSELTWGWPRGVGGLGSWLPPPGLTQNAFPWISTDNLDSVGCPLGPLFSCPHPPHPRCPAPSCWLSASSYLSESSVGPLASMRCLPAQASTQGLQHHASCRQVETAGLLPGALTAFLALSAAGSEAGLDS